MTASQHEPLDTPSGSGRAMGAGEGVERHFTYAQAAELLMSDAALPELTRPAALKVVHYMKLHLAPVDSLLFRAGHPGSPFMALLMEGDAVVEGQLGPVTPPIVLRTLAPGCIYGEMGAPDTPGRLIAIRATTEACIATLPYAGFEALMEAEGAACSELLRAMLAHVTRRLRHADTWIETLDQINRSLQEEWNAEIRSNHSVVARLAVLMRLEREMGLRSSLVGGRIDVRPQTE